MQSFNSGTPWSRDADLEDRSQYAYERYAAIDVSFEFDRVIADGDVDHIVGKRRFRRPSWP